MDPFFINSLGSITDSKTSIKWESDQFREEILRRTNFYSAEGVKANSNVAIIHNNNNNFFADLFALWILGACVACLDQDIGESEFLGLCDKFKFKFGFINGTIPQKLKKIDLAIPLINSEYAYKYEPKLIFRPVSYDDPALILFTSGSTGLPKGVVHTRRTLQSKWLFLRNHMPIEVCENTLCALPTHFGHGLICNSLYPLVNGKNLVLMPKADLNNLLNLSKIIDQYSITFMSSVAAMWRIILKVSPKPINNSLKHINIGSAPLGGELWKSVQKWANSACVWNTYGITETGSWIAGPSQAEKLIPSDGFIGKPWGGEIVVSSLNKLDDVRDIYSTLKPIYEKGYIWIRTPTLMQCYWQDRVQTNKVVNGSWFNTGDIGFFDENQNLVLSGRERNEINKGGMKISPEEIDLVIELHPDVLEACTFSYQDNILGENIGVCIVIKNVDDTDGINSTRLIEWCKEKISDYKIPSRWYLVRDIPKTSRGKVNRQNVSDFCSNLEVI